MGILKGGNFRIPHIYKVADEMIVRSIETTETFYQIILGHPKPPILLINYIKRILHAFL